MVTTDMDFHKVIEANNRKPRQKRRIVLFLLLIIFLFVGCKTIGMYKLIDVKDIPFETGPISQCRYVGSDEKFHYFKWRTLNLKSYFQNYKVRRCDLKMRKEFKYGESSEIWNPYLNSMESDSSTPENVL